MAGNVCRVGTPRFAKRRDNTPDRLILEIGLKTMPNAGYSTPAATARDRVTEHYRDSWLRPVLCTPRFRFPDRVVMAFELILTVRGPYGERTSLQVPAQPVSHAFVPR
jgi:hypothetical protein